MKLERVPDYDGWVSFVQRGDDGYGAATSVRADEVIGVTVSVTPDPQYRRGEVPGSGDRYARLWGNLELVGYHYTAEVVLVVKGGTPMVLWNTGADFDLNRTDEAEVRRAAEIVADDVKLAVIEQKS